MIMVHQSATASQYSSRTGAEVRNGSELMWPRCGRNGFRCCVTDF